MTAPLDLDALESLAAKATPGPWYYDAGNWQVESHCDDYYRAGVCHNHHQHDPGVPDSPSSPLDDGHFIAASREAVPQLIARVRELEAKNQSWIGLVDADTKYQEEQRHKIIELQALLAEAERALERVNKEIEDIGTASECAGEVVSPILQRIRLSRQG